MDACDFSNSYMFWESQYNPEDKRKPGHMPWGNSARIQLNARCEWVNERTGEEDEFFLITPCRTEWMYRSDQLWQTPNNEYCGIWSRSEFVAGHVEEGYSAASAIKDRYTDFRLTIRNFPRTQQLEDDEQIIQATLKDLPLVGRTEVWDEGRQLRAMIEYPIKTMNVLPEHKRFQVDTGPVLFPDFGRSTGRPIESFAVAFVCYNNFDLAEFILRQPTKAREDGPEGRSVLEYSDVRRLEAKNTIICAGEL